MSIVERDLRHIWHPCMQMKDLHEFAPLVVKSAQGSHLELDDGRRIIDPISSWWCKSLGHNHPRIKAALLKQIEKSEHTILANTTNETIAELGEQLANLNPKLQHVSFASDGSCAVEIAIKMSCHVRFIHGDTQRNKIMALNNGYHGETALTLSASDVGLYKDGYQPLLQTINYIQPAYVSSSSDPEWKDCATHWQKTEAQLNKHAHELTAIIVEPLLQGAGGMLVYSANFLKRLRLWCTENQVHLIADEILTGIGRTGTALACEHADVTPDFVCLSKGVTSGWLPMSVMLTSNEIYSVFYDDYSTGKAFLHSHTYSGNTLAAACAVETLKIMQEEHIYQQVRDNAHHLIENMQSIQINTQKLTNIRHIGYMVAADLVTDKPRAGYEVYKQAVQLGALLRPLGNTIYWLPPLNINRTTLDELRDITQRAIELAA